MPILLHLFLSFSKILPVLEGALLSVGSQLSIAMVGATAPVETSWCWERCLLSTGQVSSNVLDIFSVCAEQV